MMKLSDIKIVVFILLLLTVPMTMAKEDNQYLLTERTYNALNTAQDLMAAENYSAAETKLKALLKQTKSGSYEKAVVQQTLGYLYSSQEDYKKASVYFQQAFDSNALPEKVSHNLHYNLAQLLLADEQYKAGIAMLEEWLKVEESPPSSAYVLLASAAYQDKSYKKTISNIKIAINKDKAEKESWYQLLLSAHLELKQYKSAISVLETLITRYPYQKIYWTQLTALYLQQNKEFTALAVRMLAQQLDLGDAKTLISLADMYRYLHIPYKSAQLLTNALNKGEIEADYDNLTKLADSWLAAKEGQQAADVLQQVAELDTSGESDLKYGRVLFALEQWQNTLEPLNKAIERLDDEQVGKASLLLGMSQYHLGELERAKVQFSRAVAYENERNQAGQWLRHVEKQIENTPKEQVINES